MLLRAINDWVNVQNVLKKNHIFRWFFTEDIKLIVIQKNILQVGIILLESNLLNTDVGIGWYDSARSTIFFIELLFLSAWDATTTLSSIALKNVVVQHHSCIAFDIHEKNQRFWTAEAMKAFVSLLYIRTRTRTHTRTHTYTHTWTHR